MAEASPFVWPHAGVRFGRADGSPGVTLTPCRRGAIVVSLVAPRAVAEFGAIASACLGCDAPAPGRSTRGEFARLMRRGPADFIAFVEGARAPESTAALAIALGDAGAAIDCSHRLPALVVEGPAVRAVLAKLAPIDCDADVFAADAVAATLVHHMDAILWRRGADSFGLACERSVARDMLRAITTAAAEFGVAWRDRSDS